jgi:hypothetical protein
MVAVGIQAFGETALPPLQEGATNTNLVGQMREWIGVNAFAELQTAYLARGKVVDARPFSAQFFDAEAKFGEFGHAGGHAWSVTSLTGSGQGAPKRYAYNEVDYNLHYVYDLKIAEGWTLENRAARQWVTLPGYHGNAKTICEWHAAQALYNPFVTPYYLLRHSCQPEVWSYWDIGARRSFSLVDNLSLTVDFFGDCGDARHFTSQYGVKPNAPNSRYHGGLMALNLMLRLDWKVTDYLSLYAFVWQFDIVSDEARDTVKATKVPEARRDLTVGGIGLAINF